MPSSAGVQHRYGIEQLALNMGFGDNKTSVAHSGSSSSISTSPTKSTTGSLINSSNPLFEPVNTPTDSQVKFELSDDTSSIIRSISSETENDVKERVITKIDPDDLTAKPSIVTVPKDSVRRAAMLLSGPKFQLNSSEIPKEKLQINTDIIFTVSVSLRIILIDLQLKF